MNEEQKPDQANPGDDLNTDDPQQARDPHETVVPIDKKQAERLGHLLSSNLSDFDSGNLSDDELSGVKSICDRFNRVWESQAEPSISEFVAEELNEELRQLLVRDLVRVDIEQRERCNKVLEPADYLKSLGKYRFSIESAWWSHLYDLSRKAAASTGPRPLPSKASHSLRYRPLGLHARGGLGAVYKARDQELGRTVALKEIRRDRALDVANQARFVFEAEVTGSLEHPGIVPVYGFGRYADKRPYYAMRFVRGHSFRQAIEKFHEDYSQLKANKFDSREFRSLLRRFVDTCNAIHYAHEHGVLHRDIKPDNVMLGKYGETLVVDWGLAKLLDERPGSEEAVVTSTQIELSGSGTDTGYSVVGTPLFMSPEQAGGEDSLTPASDVYSLGALLFNLLTNEYPVQGDSAREILTNVREGKLREISSLASTAPRPLISICRQAMARDPGQRYATAVELAEDVERWVSDELVLAHRQHESVSDRAGRLFRRYRSWTFASAAALLAVTVVSAASLAIVNRARSQEHVARLAATKFKDQAIDRYQLARQAIDHWLVQSGNALQYFPGTQRLRARLLEMAEEDYAKLAETRSSDPQLELERARTLVGLGNLAQRQSQFDAARQHYRQAQSLLEAKSPSERAADWASEHANADTRIGLTYSLQNDFANAITSFEQAELQLKELMNPSADDLPQRYLAAAEINHGAALVEQGNLSEASEFLESGIQRLAAVAGELSSKDRFDAAVAQELKGVIFVRQGNFEMADNTFDDVAEIYGRLARQNPHHPLYADGRARLFVLQAENYRSEGHQPLELAAIEKAVRAYRTLHQAMPDVPAYAENLAIALTDQGLSLLENDAAREAEQYLGEAESLLVALITQFGNHATLRLALAGCRDAQAQVLLVLQEDPAVAEQKIVSSINLLAELLRGDQTNPDYLERIAVAISVHARILERKGSVDEARDQFAVAASTLEDLADRYPQVPAYQSSLASVYEKQGRMLYRQKHGSATAKLMLARETWTSLASSMSPNDKHDLAWMLLTCPIESVRDVEWAGQLADQICGRVEGNMKFQALRALAQLSAGRIGEAAETLHQIEASRGFWIGRDLFLLAMLQADQAKDSEADASLKAAAEWMEKNAPHDPKLRLLEELARQELND